MRQYLLLLVLVPKVLLALTTNVTADSAVLVNSDTGAVLFSKNPNKPQYPASVGKMATALYALHSNRDDLDRVVIADGESLARVDPQAKRKANYGLPAYWLENDAKLVNIRQGEELSLRDLLYATLVASAGDGANLVAREVGGSITRFMEEMNLYLRDIGCTQTLLKNPHGLHHPEQKSTALDLSLIAREALKYPEFRQIVSTVEHQLPGTSQQKARRLKQTNRLLNKKKPEYYAHAIGVKTGWTGDSLNTFVAAAERDGRTLVAVLLRAEKRAEIFQDAKRLFEKAFAEKKKSKRAFAKGTQEFFADVKGGQNQVQGALHEDLLIEFFPSEKPSLKASVRWNALEAPVEKGSEVGELIVTATNLTFEKRIPIFVAERVSATFLKSYGWPMAGIALLSVGCFAIRFRASK